VFKNLKIGVRIGLAFTIVLILLVLISTIAYTKLVAINTEIESIVSNRYPKTVIAHDVVDQINIIARALRNSLLVKQPEEVKKELARVTDARKKIADGLDKLNQSITSDSGKKVIGKALVAQHIYVVDQDAFLELVKSNKRDEAVEFMITELRKTQSNYIDSVNELISYLSDRMVETSQAAKEMATATERFIVIFGAIFILLTILLGWFLTHGIIRPVNFVVDAANKMAAGDFNFKLELDSHDEVGLLAKAVEGVQASVQRMVADAVLLAKAAVEGKLATRADASQHQGDFQKVVIGVNNTLDAVIGPLNVTAKYVDDISKGIIPPIITDSYNGDFNIIKNNLNNVVKMMSDLLAQTDIIIQGAANGELKKRANADLFVGGWNQLVKGVNDTITNIVNPLNVTANYVDRISRGDIPPKITDPYSGDYNIIKNNLNTCIDAVNALVADAGLLAKAAVEGRLETRADASQHQGDFQKIVIGVNDTLDNVVGPINEVRRIMGAMSGGDLSQTITTAYRGDFDELKSAINQTVVKLVEIIGEVRAAADNLTNAAGQVSATAQSLSQSSSEQAASVEETTSSMEQMTASISQNTENAKITDGMAAKAAKEAAEGGEAVTKTVDDMKSIASKIGIIDDIAYQTNLLALNAAIEAARAGDHGKGFAVVAAEVRKLAERSQIAAQEIGNLASSSVKQAERAGTLLTEMVPTIRKTSDLVQEIASASSEQSSGVAQINGAMGQLNQATQQNASASEQLAATAEELGSQAEQLQQTMTFFRLDDSSRNNARKAPPVTRASGGKGKASTRTAAVQINEGDFERY